MFLTTHLKHFLDNLGAQEIWTKQKNNIIENVKQKIKFLITHLWKQVCY